MSAVSTAASVPSFVLPERAPAIPPAVRRGAWQLAAGQATSLRATQASVLRVRQGRLWITRDAAAASEPLGGSEDLVVGPGESLAVARGQRIVMEPWDGHGATYSWDAEG